MDFDYLHSNIPKILQAQLPAKIAHDIMSHPERNAALKKLETITPRYAAVMMLIYPKNKKAHLVLIVRNAYEGVHSAQVAFPGGKQEKHDGDFKNTALRETNEEIGVSPDKIQIIRPFTELYIPPSNFMVYPFLGISIENLTFTPDPKEVAQIIELPISALLDDSNIKIIKRNTSYAKDILIPVFQSGEHIIWGATAMILNELKMVLSISI